MPAENNTRAAPGVPFKPGQSGNPGGRPKGLAKATREVVGGDGLPIAELWWQIASDVKRKDSDRLEASKLLAERGWGKAPNYAPMEAEDPLGLEDVDKELETIADELAKRREAKTAQLEAIGTVVGPGTNGSTPPTR